MANESTFIGHRKYFQQPTKLYSFFRPLRYKKTKYP